MGQMCLSGPNVMPNGQAGLGDLGGPKVVPNGQAYFKAILKMKEKHKSKSGLPRVTMGLDKSLN